MFVDPDDFYPEITDNGVKDLYKLAEIVLHCHFNYVSPTDKEDLTSAAILKAISFIRMNNFDPNRSSLKNVLYTAMRNEMKNTLYRQSREVLVDDEVLIGTNAAEEPIEAALHLIVFDELKLPRCRELHKVRATMAYLGFNIKSKEVKYYPEVERWIAIAVHQKVKKIR